MSTLWLKILACVAMLCDHIGYFSHYGFTEYGDAMRAFGRIAFPIFSYLIAYGYSKTGNKYKYLLRLIAVGLISELPFRYCFWGKVSFFTLTNVYFTLALGLAAIILSDYCAKSGTRLVYFSFLPVIIAAVAANILGTDYGAYGVLLIFFFHISGTNRIAISACSIVFAARKIILAYAAVLYHSIKNLTPLYWPSISKWDYMQLFAVLAVVPILFCDGSRGYELKSKVSRKVVQYSFYLFYPLHLLILGLIIRKLVM